MELNENSVDLVVDPATAEAGVHNLTLTIENEFNLTSSYDFSLEIGADGSIIKEPEPLE